MFISKEDKLKTLASRGDHLAEYYLGKYYLEEKNSVDEGLTWLLKSSYGDPRYAIGLLKKLATQYNAKIRSIKKTLLSS
jgi:hypothetical protein